MSTINNNSFFALIDKPIGMTSFDVIRQLKKTSHIKKIGHTGTLDPLATGLLLVAFGDYTKLIPYFEKDTKEYEFELSLEGTTLSLDAEEEVIPAPSDIYEKLKKELTEKQILEILEKHFTGEIEQIPPKYSALKIDGKRAVDRVRNGEDVEMKKRNITVQTIELINFNFPKIVLRAEVSAGTYIRTIAGDFGDILGTGAYVTKLRRTKIGVLGLELSQSLESFDPQNILAIEHILGKYDTLNLDEEIMTRLNHGQRIRNTFGIRSGEYFIKNDTHVTHIIEADEYLLKLKRKIV